jgi:hypothetical protein
LSLLRRAGDEAKLWLQGWHCVSGSRRLNDAAVVRMAARNDHDTGVRFGLVNARERKRLCIRRHRRCLEVIRKPESRRRTICSSEVAGAGRRGEQQKVRGRCQSIGPDQQANGWLTGGGQRVNRPRRHSSRRWGFPIRDGLGAQRRRRHPQSQRGQNEAEANSRVGGAGRPIPKRSSNCTSNMPDRSGPACGSFFQMHTGQTGSGNKYSWNIASCVGYELRVGALGKPIAGGGPDFALSPAADSQADVPAAVKQNGLAVAGADQIIERSSLRAGHEIVRPGHDV